MGLRNIMVEGDDVLRKRSREVTTVDDRIRMILDDMLETMHESDGVGIAAPQVGILRRMFIVEAEEGDIFEIINPEIIEMEGSFIGEEGCLSVPGEQGEVERPYKVKVKALNEKGEEIIVEGEELLARALCHEIDHLEGVLFVDKVINAEGGK